MKYLIDDVMNIFYIYHKKYFPRFWEACWENFGELSPTTTTRSWTWRV